VYDWKIDIEEKEEEIESKFKIVDEVLINGELYFKF